MDLFHFDFTVTSAILLGALILLVAYSLGSHHHPSYPPCPIHRWPILGHLLLLRENPRSVLRKFRNQCGDIFSLYFGPTLVVVVNGYDLVKEAFVKRGDEFSERSPIYLDVVTDCVNKGLAFSNGAVWRDNRSVSINILRKFDTGENKLDDKLQDEIAHYLDLLESYKGKPKEIEDFSALCAFNMMCVVLVGKRFEYDDALLKRVRNIMTAQGEEVKWTTVLNYIPILRFLPGDLFRLKLLRKHFYEFLDVFVSVFAKESEDVTGEADSYIAAYTQVMNTKPLPNTNKENLSKSVYDLLLAGTDTIAVMLCWSLLYMLNYPQIQEKVFQEIKAEIGMSRSPTMRDKTKLTYLNAVIMEIVRIAYMAPLLLPRTVQQDTTLAGYTVPKGAQLLVNMDSIFTDKATWGDVGVFRPERFIGEKGNLVVPEQFIPFSVGRRSCLGEGLAKMELFLFMANILQRFKLLPESENTVPPIKGTFHVTYVPDSFRIRFVKRK